MTRPVLSFTATGLGKRHGRTWVWRHLDCSMEPGGTLALLGANGSGKSSILRILCGFDTASEGDLHWAMGHEDVARADLPGHIGYCAPDQALIHDFTVQEHLVFHRACRASSEAVSLADMLTIARLEDQAHRRIGQLSSGMRQRLALTLAFTTPSSALFLDEPTSHLDDAGQAWYLNLLDEHRGGRTLVVASNRDRQEVPRGAMEVVLGLDS